MLKTIFTIIGAIAGILSLLYFLFPQIIRWRLRPKIEIKHVMGDLEEVEFGGAKLFTRRKVTLGIQNKCNRPLKLESVTFRRLCRFQKQCLLFRYLQKTHALSNKDWCQCSSVTDLDFVAAGFEQPTEEEKKKIVATFADEGKLKLTPAHNVIPKKRWREFEVPLKLRDAKPHIVELTLSFDNSFEDISPSLRALHRVVNPTSEKTGYSHTLIRNIIVDLCSDEDLEASISKQKEELGGEFRAAYSYFHEPAMFQAQLKSLEIELMHFLSKNYPVSEISAEDLRKTLKENLPEADIVYSSPPNDRYRAISKDEVEGILKVWSTFRNICKEFLDCEQYAILNYLFVRVLIHPALPRLMECTYKYLVLSSHSPLVDLKVNVSKRTTPLPLVLFKFVIDELKILAFGLKTKRSLKREVDHIAESVKQLS
ncbi:MAG: hypothetical protein EF812_02675 [Methanosarcinales archaeon]|nr:MAG: hypothetical protein EF812_02675 [Methanosarcinales archaeon]